MMIELPPVEADLLCLVNRADQQANPDRQELDLSERDLDISCDDEPFVQDAIENVDQTGGSSVPLRQWRRHRVAILRTLNLLVRSLFRCWSRDDAISAMAMPQSVTESVAQ